MENESGQGGPGGKAPLACNESVSVGAARQAQHPLLYTYFRRTQPVPLGGAVQKTWILLRLRGVLSVTAGGQLVMNCVSSSSIICNTTKHK